MTLYKIRDWNEEFENNRSRMVKDLSWVAVPNRWDGENYTALITSKDGAEVFAAWVLMVQVASRCHPRGSLLRGAGKPHDSASLSLKTRAPKSWFDKAIKFLTEHTDWLEIEDVAGHCHQLDVNMQDECQPSDEGRKEGENGKDLANSERKKAFEKPTLEQVRILAQKSGLPEVEADKFFYHYDSKGWKVGREPMKSLGSAIGGWTTRWRTQSNGNNPTASGQKSYEGWAGFQ